MFCYVVGNSIKTLLAGKLHFLWRMGMGHPSRAGIWASGLAARFITSHPPGGVRTGGISASDPGWPQRNKTMPWNLCPTQILPTTLPSPEHLPQELAEPPRPCCMSAPPGFGAAQGIWHSRGQKNFVPVMGSFPTAKDKYFTPSCIHHAGPFTHFHPSLMSSFITFS